MRFSRIEEGEIEERRIDDVIAVELMGVALHMMGMKLRVKDAWILLTAYDEPIIPSTNRRDILMRIRLLLQDYDSKDRWFSVCQYYEKIDKKYKIVNSLDDEEISLTTPAVFHERIDKYKKILSEPLQRVQMNRQFLSENEYTYFRRVDNEPKQFSGSFSENFVKGQAFLESYREKRDIDMLSIEALREVAKEVDEQLKAGRNDWQLRLAPLSLEQSFVSDGVHHIIGGLGAGKTTYRELMTYAAIKRKGARVLLVEHKVTDVFEKANFFRKLGINVVPITGIHRQMDNLQSVTEHREVRTAKDIDDELAYRYLTGDCLIRTFAGDFSYEREYERFLPCKVLREKDGSSNLLCPLVEYCGIYEALYDLKDADLWITTEAALLTMQLPPMIDPYERTLYEAAYDLVDLIFIDEADQAKRTFENKFVDEVTLFSSGKLSAVAKLHSENIQILETNPESSNDEVHGWRNNSYHLLHNVQQLYQLINENIHVAWFMKRHPVYVKRLLLRLLSNIEDSRRIKKLLNSYITRANYDSEHPLSALGRFSKGSHKVQAAEEWMTTNRVEFKKKAKLTKREWIDELFLFIYLANIQSGLDYVRGNRYMAQKYNLDIAGLLLDSRIEGFLPFIREPMTSLKYGFHFEHSGQVKQIKLLVYQGIGSDLFYHWHDLFRAINGNVGPELVYLSGTSYAKGSPHYHLEQSVHWTLTTERKKPKIEQFILPLEEEGELLYVSGLDTVARENALRKMVERVTDTIIAELAVWEERGEERRVLLIVNSYRDAEVVHRALKQNALVKDRYLVLTREKDTDDEGAFHPANLLKLNEQKEDILAAPLLSMNRGYNILQKNSDESLFGSVFFLTRPYPTPNDLQYFVAYLHGLYPYIIKEIEKKGLVGLEALRKLRQRSNAIFRKMYQEAGTWVRLTDDEKRVLSLYTFIPIWQLIGRLLRGGTDARVFYCDAKFFTDFNGEPTMIDYWKKVLLDDADQSMQELYGPFIEGLEQLEVGG